MPPLRCHRRLPGPGLSGVDPLAARGFGRAAEIYERARPSYPPEAIDWLAERLGIGPGKRVLDLAAGTGKLTRLLPATGAEVIAVEPLPAMREFLAETAPGVEALEGTAEAIPLPDGSIDTALVAQAIHWFRLDEAFAELRRVLRPGGGLAVLWNDRNPDDEFHATVVERFRLYRGRDPVYSGSAWPGAIEADGAFAPVGEAQFPHEHEVDTEALMELVGSWSRVAALPEPERREVLAEVPRLREGLPERFPLRYVTYVHAYRRA